MSAARTNPDNPSGAGMTRFFAIELSIIEDSNAALAGRATPDAAGKARPTVNVMNYGKVNNGLFNVILAACLLALACPSAGAAEWFRYRINPPELVDIFLSGNFESDKSVRPTSRSTIKTTTTTEALDIRTDGWVYHPALMTFEAGLQPEFEQRNTKYDGGGKRESVGTFLGFNIDASVLPYKPYTIDLHARQDRSKYRSTLAQDQISESSTYRAKLLLKEYWMPSTITLETRDRITKSPNAAREGTVLAKLESRHRSESSDTRLETAFEERTRENPGSKIASQHMLLNARNHYQPGENSKLNSVFNHKTDRMADGDRAQTSLNGNLSVRHRKELSSNYGLTLENQSEQGSNSRSGAATASLQHQLYENLATSLNGNAGKSQSDSGNMEDYGAGLNFAYTRPIPWGKINASLGRTDQIRDWQRVLAEEKITREPHTVTLANPWVMLARIDVVPGSVKILDTADTPCLFNTCTKDVDYSVTTIGRETHIQWLNFGAAVGFSISVDYSHTADPSAKTRQITDTFGIGVNLWSMLGLNYTQNKTRADLLSGTPSTGDTQDRFSQALSSSLNLGWRSVKSVTRASITKTELAAEKMEGGRGAATQEALNLGQSFRVGNWSATSFEMADQSMSGDRSASSRSPTRTHRARQIFSFRPMRYLSASVGASLNETEYKETDDRIRSSDYDATMYWLLGAGSLTAKAYRQELQGLTEETGSTGLEADYQWRYFTWKPTIRFSLVEKEQRPLNAALGNSKNTKFVLYFEVRRELN